MDKIIPDDCNSAIEQDTKNQHAVCSVCGAEFPAEDMHTIDGALLCQSCFSKRNSNKELFGGEEDVLSIDDAITSLRAQIITDITKNPVLKYPLASLLWSDAAKCFPGPGFNWDGAWFNLDLQTGKLLVDLGTYPNAFGASRSDCINLSAVDFNKIAKQFHMRKELQAFESDDDWAELFDESLKAAVSSACAILQKRDEERRNEEIKQYSVKIPEQYANQTPDMCLSKFTIEIWQRYSSRSIEVSNDNGNYKIVYILRSHTSPQLDIYPRVLSAAESVWLEKQVEITINNPDESTWTSLPGGDMMNLLIKRDMGPNIEIKCVKPIKKYSDLQNELEHLAQYGSTLCQQADLAAAIENKRMEAEKSRRREEEKRRRQEEEKRRREEENRRRAAEKEKRGRIIEILTCAAIVLLCVVKLAFFPNIWHREAGASIDDGGYGETIAISSEPETDEDSAKKILETEHISDTSSGNTYLLGDTGMSIDIPSGSFVLTREDLTEDTSENPSPSVFIQTI